MASNISEGVFGVIARNEVVSKTAKDHQTGIETCHLPGNIVYSLTQIGLDDERECSNPPHASSDVLFMPLAYSRALQYYSSVGNRENGVGLHDNNELRETGLPLTCVKSPKRQDDALDTPSRVLVF